MCEPTGSYYWKREPAWTNLRGMWGKRSPQADADAVDDDHGNPARSHTSLCLSLSTVCLCRTQSCSCLFHVVTSTACNF
uniref:Prothoracicostatic peptide 2 n=1 Tax=Spodoptera exigua TaxID=7107 RepID=A0A385H8Z1_SPOEX|nr:prothoracicostatic peptide 2 [Spodoptera exigua]